MRRLLENTFIKTTLTITILMIAIVHWKNQDSLINKAMRTSLSGTAFYTLSNMYQSQLQLSLISPAELEQISLDLSVLDEKYKVISSFFGNSKKDLLFFFAAAEKQDVVLVTVRNKKIVSLQKVKAIQDKKIKLQYGEISLSSKPELIAEESDTAIVL